MALVKDVDHPIVVKPFWKYLKGTGRHKFHPPRWVKTKLLFRKLRGR